MRAAHDEPVVSVLAVAARCGPDLALRDAPAWCEAAVFKPKTRFGRHALASAWARFGRPTWRNRDR